MSLATRQTVVSRACQQNYKRKNAPIKPMLWTVRSPHNFPPEPMKRKSVSAFCSNHQHQTLHKGNKKAEHQLQHINQLTSSCDQDETEDACVQGWRATPFADALLSSSSPSPAAFLAACRIHHPKRWTHRSMTPSPFQTHHMGCASSDECQGPIE